MKTVERSQLERILWENRIPYRELAEAAGLTRTVIYYAVRGSCTDNVRAKITAGLRLVCQRRQIEFIDPFGENEND